MHIKRSWTEQRLELLTLEGAGDRMSKVRTNLTPKVYTDGLTVLAKRAKLTRKCYVEKSFAPVRVHEPHVK